MLQNIGRLFTIKTRAEAYLIIYALALGATSRGAAYLEQYPGWGGKLLFLACTGAVFIAGGKDFRLPAAGTRGRCAGGGDGEGGSGIGPARRATPRAARGRDGPLDQVRSRL